MPRVGAVVFVALASAACRPDPAAREVCGYRCGPNAACPDNFACYADGRCHREGSPEDGCIVDSGPDSAPSIIEAHPSDNEQDWPTDKAIEIVFDEPVFGVDDVAITLRPTSQFDPVPATVTYSSQFRTAFVVPVKPLFEDGLYVITVAPTITDASGQTFGGRSWNFSTTSDTMPPSLTSMSPAPGATNVGVETPVVIGFSEHVFDITPASFTVQDLQGNSAGTITYLAPALAKREGPWQSNTTYRVTVTSAITDLRLNPLVGAPYVWAFTTGPDTVPPRILFQFPRVDALGMSVQTMVRVRFSEPVIGVSSESVFLERDGAVVPSTVMYDSASNMLSLVPVGDLAPATAYVVTILPTLTDLAGNPVVPGVMSWTFTTQ
ncbi:MAG: Ig-like domain-containing protein [Kofleriaceae bacterium]|nr:Ig-like domain-containing protein [Kofleriaceae bacterium]